MLDLARLDGFSLYIRDFAVTDGDPDVLALLCPDGASRSFADGTDLAALVEAVGEHGPAACQATAGEWPRTW